MGQAVHLAHPSRSPTPLPCSPPDVSPFPDSLRISGTMLHPVYCTVITCSFVRVCELRLSPRQQFSLTLGARASGWRARVRVL